jgi:outer membrane protein W
MYINRKRVLFLIMISMSLYIYTQAQDSSSERNSLKEGAWALQFGIAGNLTLTSFQGTTMAVKYQLSDRTAIRGGITISANTNNGNSSADEDTSNSADAINVSFVLQYLWYVNPSGPIHFYVGVGPSVAYSYSHNSLNYSSPDVQNGQLYWDQYSNASNSHQWMAGGIGVAGVEWFASQWLSLRAEYSEGIQYQWHSMNSTSDVSSTNTDYLPNNYSSSGTTKGWTLSSSGVSFGLNVYW